MVTQRGRSIIWTTTRMFLHAFKISDGVHEKARIENDFAAK